MSDNINDLILEASERASHRAFEIAVRTGTALIFSRNGKIVRVKPPFRYELISTKPKKKQAKKPLPPEPEELITTP